MAVILATACGGAASNAGGDGYGEPGAPLPGLSLAGMTRFEQGSDLFFREFTSGEGLGPIFNQKRCSSCHDLPTNGGFGAEIVRKATHWDGSRCDLLGDEGGDVFQHQLTEELAALGGTIERIPARATELADVLPPALYGLGLVEQIPDSVIAVRADPDDADGDGISGRMGRDAQGRPGRFGRRSEFATLRDFTHRALLVEMGLTTTTYPADEGVNRTPLPDGADPAADPEVADSIADLLVDFIRFLAVPAREAATGATADTVRRGERMFRVAGCESCHVPVMQGGRSEIPALDRKRVALYSDLLVHDLGADNASVCGPNASPSEWRTSPLMGVRLRQPLMSTGRARDLESAIELHGGEALASKHEFDRMDPAERAALLRFLRSL